MILLSIRILLGSLIWIRLLVFLVSSAHWGLRRGSLCIVSLILVRFRGWILVVLILLVFRVVMLIGSGVMGAEG